MKAVILTWVILAVSMVLSVAALAQPTVTIYTDADTYQSGDTIEVSLSADNPGAGVSVDAYVGLLTQDGVIYALGPAGWSSSIEAWIPNIYIPSGFSFGPAALWSFDVPCSIPPIGAEGDYNFAALLTRPGTFEWLSSLSLAPFTVSVTSLDYYVSGNLGSDINDGSKRSPWRTITHALASVTGAQSSPVTIHVLPGRYGPSTNGETFPLNMKSWVSISGDSAKTTVLDAEQSAYHVIYCGNFVSQLTIEKMTITGGNATGTEDADKSGGGIYCFRSSPTISNNRIEGNSADHWGGGMACYTFSSPTVSNNRIKGNTAGYGAGIYIHSSSPSVSGNTITGNTATTTGGGIQCWSNSSATIEDNTITNNSALNGGGIYCYNSSPTIKNNTIESNTVESNTTTTNGGGIYCCYNSSPTIEGNTITDNTAVNGGGIYCTNSSPTIRGNSIENNATQFLGYGAGIYCEANSSPTIESNTVSGNTAGGHAGGIYCHNSSPTISNNVIEDNSANVAGGICCESNSSPTISDNIIIQNTCLSIGGIYCWDHSCPTIRNNIVADNTGEGGMIACEWYSSPMIRNNTITQTTFVRNSIGINCQLIPLCPPTIVDCIIWGNDLDLRYCSATYCCIEEDDSGSGNIHDDPKFVSGPLGDFYLHPSSPCIDTGSRLASAARCPEVAP